jgi:hypothetical protein
MTVRVLHLQRVQIVVSRQWSTCGIRQLEGFLGCRICVFDLGLGFDARLMFPDLELN